MSKWVQKGPEITFCFHKKGSGGVKSNRSIKENLIKCYRILKKVDIYNNGIQGSNLWAAQQSLICGIIPGATSQPLQ